MTIKLFNYQAQEFRVSEGELITPFGPLHSPVPRFRNLALAQQVRAHGARLEFITVVTGISTKGLKNFAQ